MGARSAMLCYIYEPDAECVGIRKLGGTSSTNREFAMLAPEAVNIESLAQYHTH